MKPAEKAVKEAPPVLLPYQQAWVADDQPVAVWEKSRRIGASWAEAATHVLAASPAEGAEDGLYIGYSQDMTREFIDDCAMWARAFNRAAGAVQETLYEDEGEAIKAFRIDFASGHKILALSSRPRSLRGKQGRVTIDEAAFHDSLEELLKAALAMLIWGGKVRVLSTHNGEDNPFNLLIKEIRAGKRRYSLHHTDFTEALAQGLFERVKLVMGARLKAETRDAWRDEIYALYGESAREELDCIPRAGSGVYLPRTLVERCMVDGIPILRLAKPAEWVHDSARRAEAQTWCADHLDPVIDALDTSRRTVWGQDFGRSGDLSVIWVLQEAQSGVGRWRTAFVLELRRIPFDVQQLIAAHICDRLPLWHHAKLDARGNGQAHAEQLLQSYGLARIECVMATASWYAANFPRYKAALEDGSIEMPRSEDIIADHRRAVLVKGNPTMDDGRDRGSDGEPRHGDSVIAALMAWCATLQEGQPPAGASIDADVQDYAPERPGRGRRLFDLFGRRSHTTENETR